VAIIHRATIAPTKQELAGAWLDRQGLGAGDVEMLGSYRFDDPEREVGTEAHLISTMEHSVLGRRWVYEAMGDPVALACYAAALAGQQEQAIFEIWDGGVIVGQRPNTVTLTVEGDGPAGREVRLYRVTGDSVGRPAVGRCLVATWDTGSGVVASV
jgi:hypothetical protein